MISIYLTVFAGAVIASFISFVWGGLPIFLIGLITRPKRVQRYGLALSSVPALVNSKTVYEFIQTLRDPERRGEYDQIMSTIRKLLLDIQKNRQQYPEDIEELKVFVLTQLRYNIENSGVRHAVETSKFRDLAEEMIATEVMQTIRVADIKASRAELMRRTARGG